MGRWYNNWATTFYVNNVAGSDANDGSTPALAFQTIQHAVNNLQDNFDWAAQPTIQLATTGVDYNENVILGKYVGSLRCNVSSVANYTFPRIAGDTTNNFSVQCRPTTGTPFTSVTCDPWILDSLQVASHTANGVVSDARSHILLNNINFGICAAAHMAAEYGGFIETLAGPYTISGTAQYHISSQMGAKWVAQGNPVTFLNTYGAWPAFYYFAQGASGGLINMGQMTFVAGGYTSAHPGTESNDGTALMYPPPTGWP